MIVVTGFRSGTSMMMQTLRLLGVPVLGIPFHNDFSHSELNPKGYYDLPIRMTINGMNTEKYKGRALKLYGHQLSKTDPKYISKLIIMERNEEDTVKSIVRLLKADSNMHDLEPSEENASLLRFVNNDLIDRYASKKDHIRINFEDTIIDPVCTINKVMSFLNIDVPIGRAVSNVTR